MVDRRRPALECMEELCAAIADMQPAEGIAAIAESRSRLAAVEARLLASQIPPGGGTRDAEQTLLQEGRHGKQAARRTAERASTITALPDVGEQLSAGAITPEHVDAVSEAIRRTSTEAVAKAPELLTEISELPVDKARAAAREWADTQIDEATAADREQRQRRRRRARMYGTDKGMVALYAEFDAVTGAAIRGALNARAEAAYRADGGRQIGKDRHPRTRDQRMADVLAEAIAGGGSPAAEPGSGRQRAPSDADDSTSAPHHKVRARDGATWSPETAPASTQAQSVAGEPIDGQDVRRWYTRRSRPELIVATDLTTLLRLTSPPAREEPRRLSRPTTPPDEAPVPAESAPPGRIVGGPSISRQTLERLACHSELAALVIDQQGRPLHMGRKVRLATPAQFEALVARDRGCVLCGGHWQQTIAHHLTPWTAPARGRTDIDNLALLCEHTCHHHVHANDLTLENVEGRWLTRPARPEERPARPPSRTHNGRAA